MAVLEVIEIDRPCEGKIHEREVGIVSEDERALPGSAKRSAAPVAVTAATASSGSPRSE